MGSEYFSGFGSELQDNTPHAAYPNAAELASFRLSMLHRLSKSVRRSLKEVAYRRDAVAVQRAGIAALDQLWRTATDALTLGELASSMREYTTDLQALAHDPTSRVMALLESHGASIFNTKGNETGTVELANAWDRAKRAVAQTNSSKKTSRRSKVSHTAAWAEALRIAASDAMHTYQAGLHGSKCAGRAYGDLALFIVASELDAPLLHGEEWLDMAPRDSLGGADWSPLAWNTQWQVDLHASVEIAKLRLRYLDQHMRRLPSGRSVLFAEYVSLPQMLQKESQLSAEYAGLTRQLEEEGWVNSHAGVGDESSLDEHVQRWLDAQAAPS